MKIIATKTFAELENSTLTNRKVIRNKSRKTLEVIPAKVEAPDFSIKLFQNIDSNAKIYMKFKSGLVLPMDYIDTDTTEQGIFIVDKYPNLYKHEGENRDIVRNSLRVSKLMRDVCGELSGGTEAYIDMLTAKTMNVGSHESMIDNLTGSISQSDIDFNELLIKNCDLLEYKFIPIEELNSDTHFMLEDYGIMISINDHTTPYPTITEYDKTPDGVSIIIHNSKNPTKIYYTKLFGNVVKVPVKHDNKRKDGIVIMNTINTTDEIEYYPLEDMKLLGIYENIEDAEVNGDAELQLKLKELQVKSKDLDSKGTSNVNKLELENIKSDLEKEKLKHEQYKNDTEYERDKSNKILEQLQMMHEKEKMDHEREINNLKKQIEERKHQSTETKAKHDETSSMWKTIAAVVGATVSIIGLIWKFFF